MSLENEFLPVLNNWLLLAALITFGLYWAKKNCIEPKLKELRSQQGCNGSLKAHRA